MLAGLDLWLVKIPADSDSDPSAQAILLQTLTDEQLLTEATGKEAYLVSGPLVAGSPLQCSGVCFFCCPSCPNREVGGKAL